MHSIRNRVTDKRTTATREQRRGQPPTAQELAPRPTLPDRHDQSGRLVYWIAQARQTEERMRQRNRKRILCLPDPIGSEDEADLYFGILAESEPLVVVRLAGLLHLVAHANDPFPWLTAITVDTLAQAIQIGMYLLEHAKAAYGEMGADPVVEDARAIVRWLERKGLDTVSTRDIFNDMRGRFKQVAEMTPALNLLIDHGYLCSEPAAARSGPGRKPSPRFLVNPYLGTQIPHFPQNADTALAQLTTKRLRELDALLPDLGDVIGAEKEAAERPA